MEDCIYFAVGFKSFDINRITGTAGEWYEWTERRRNAITRTSFSKRSMIWIMQILREASKMKGNVVKRWKKTENLSEIFCARNFNKFGRYISSINVRGRRRSVIIIPELTFNSGWEFIAVKVGRFLFTQKMEENRIEQRLVDDNIPYAEALRSRKWIDRSDTEVNVEPTLMGEGPIHIDDNTSTISEVLKRSLVGFFELRDKNQDVEGSRTRGEFLT